MVQLLTFKDLISPEQKEAQKLLALQQKCEKEKPALIDAIVRAVNADRIPYPIYVFQNYFDDYNQKGLMYEWWTAWLQKICEQYPTLPDMKITIPSQDYGPTRHPQIEER